MDATAIDSGHDEPVPHRWHVLQVLRAMRHGHPFIRLWDTAFSMHLEGVPLAVHYFDFLERNGYIVPAAQHGLQACYYTLSARGIELHDQGERWWRSLRWPQKTRVMWGG